MKIIFLDIDGVLSTQNVSFYCFDSSCVIRLNKILEQSKAKIVISSTWRKGRTIEQLKDLFLCQGDRHKTINNPIIDPTLLIDKTPVLTDSQKEDLKLRKNLDPELFGRGLEISAWIDLTKDNIESYLVLDDDIADIAPHLHRHIKTDCYLGLQDHDIEPSLKILNTNLSNKEREGL